MLSVIAIGVQVTMVLTLVGLSQGMLDDMQRRARGVGADILVRPPTSSVITMSGGMPAKIAERIEQIPHVKVATGILQQGSDLFNYVTGVDLEEFNTLSGGFRLVSGTTFQGPDDVIVDDYYATQH